MDSIVIVSSDGHVSAPVDVYARYLAKPFHPLLWRLSRENEEFVQLFGGFGRPKDEDFDIFDTRGAQAAGAEFGSWDAERRIRELDAEGITAELLLATTPFSTTPFFSVANRPWPADVRFAGASSWNRLLGEMARTAGGRLHGVAEPGPCHDISATIDELEWCAENGCVSTTVPGSPADPTLPPLHDAHFEPLWSACEELRLVLSVHAGWGVPQGHLHETLERESLENVSLMDVQKKLARLDLGPRSVFWKLMLAGVFDRHPRLMLALTEIRADWLPATLAHLDDRLTPSNSPIAMAPSEYFRRHCVIVPSSIHRAEVAMRHEIGIPQMLFGADYPHFEGTWPNTWDWIRDAFADVPEAEARAILGHNAIRAFNLDERLLTAVAKRVGPTPAQVLGGVHVVDSRLLEHFEKRAAYGRPAEIIDTDELDEWIRRDLDAVMALQPH